MFGSSIVYFIIRLINIYQILIVVACILTWVPRQPGSTFDDVASAIMQIANPWLSIFRRIIPPMGGIDFSPIVAILALQLIMRLLVLIL